MNQILKSTMSAIGLGLAFLGLTFAEERFDLRVRTDFFAGFAGNQQALDRAQDSGDVRTAQRLRNDMTKDRHDMIKDKQDVVRDNGAKMVTTRCPILIDGQVLKAGRGSPTVGERPPTGRRRPRVGRRWC